MEKIFDLRFIVPPTLFLGLIFMSGSKWFLCHLQPLLQLKDVGILIGIFGSFGLLTLGFIISSITNIFVRYYKLTATYEQSEEKVLKDYFKNRDKYNSHSGFLEFNKETKENLCNCEIASWIMANKAGKYVRDQIDKRWNVAMVNFNCFVASLLSFFTLVILKICHFGCHISIHFYFSYIFTIILMFIFVYSGQDALHSVRTMDKILVWDSRRKDNEKK